MDLQISRAPLQKSSFSSSTDSSRPRFLYILTRPSQCSLPMSVVSLDSILSIRVRVYSISQEVSWSCLKSRATNSGPDSGSGALGAPVPPPPPPDQTSSAPLAPLNPISTSDWIVGSFQSPDPLAWWIEALPDPRGSAAPERWPVRPVPTTCGSPVAAQAATPS